MVCDEFHGLRQCEQGKQSKRQRQVWYEEFATPVLHSFLQKFDIIRICWRPQTRYYRVQRTDGRHDWSCVQFQALRGGEEPVLWWVGSSSRWAEAFFELSFAMPLRSCIRSKEAPIEMQVVALRWNPCIDSPQAVLIISSRVRQRWSTTFASASAPPKLIELCYFVYIYLTR